jgi:hypothetical protein
MNNKEIRQFSSTNFRDLEFNNYDKLIEILTPLQALEIERKLINYRRLLASTVLPILEKLDIATVLLFFHITLSHIYHYVIAKVLIGSISGDNFLIISLN